MPNNPDFSYLNENGKRVAGPPSFLHYVYTEKGGIQNYNDEVGEAYIKKFVKQNSDDINEELTLNARKSRFRAG
jgi:hypothetical protein